MNTPICPADSSTTDLLFKPKQLRELVQGVPWLGALDDAEAAALLEHSELKTLKNREWLFRQDAPAHWLYIVINGAVRLARSAGDGRLATIRCVERGGTLGELSMVSRGGIYLYSAEALRRTHVLAIPAEHCREIMDRQPECRAEFMSRLALELTERLEDLALLTQADAMSRLVSYILRQLPVGRSKSPRVVRLSIPKRWLAAQLAMTPETLSRLLAKLRDSGAINIDRQRLVVLDEQKLRDIMLTDD
ncbi:Crp/Fnr family transcriptional regulator [Billgrantia gudaonensis]|uniref:cAMP-binding domain of CRP or a regulatory subunit of cAMP-dependent protein kinases n=1 Tax=Billgrantia gudaonensis TaxID=376427 RepID=A0A1G8PZC1_9GAMM|nr:Crp/Fnr family transcriptional regulator [Halomonas gudaonensis]SDI97811.1 cAMP-binding domain of CRP or a regulatory subunit of cAMP-dependent protein kinases [Halomonas gudaonensis]